MTRLGIAWERCFLVDGRLVVGPALHLVYLTDSQLDELMRMVRRMKLDPESREHLTRNREELRTCVDWFISLDGRYAVLRHISYGEGKDVSSDEEIYFDKLSDSPVQEILHYLRTEVSKNPFLKLRAQRSSRVAKKLVRRVKISKAGVASIYEAMSIVEADLVYLNEASIYSLVVAFLMDKQEDEHARYLQNQVEGLLKRILRTDRERLTEQAKPFDEMFDLRGLTFKELERRRARGKKLLNRFFYEFPEEFGNPNPLYISQMLPDVGVTQDAAIQEFCDRLSDDELLEFVCAYGGYTNGRWDLRSKTIAFSVDSRLHGGHF